MAWNEIVIDVAQGHAERLSDALMEAGALSVSVEDADLGTAAERPLFGEPGMLPTHFAWEHSRVVALTESDTDPATLIATAVAQAHLPFDVATLPFVVRTVADQDWVCLTQSQFAPIKIGQNIWVVPSWHDAPDPSALILELDPGLAFGTGSHPTTRLCMEWLEAHAPIGKTVLDYGCGSGILALIAKKLGAGAVVGVDIDPQAIESAGFNSRRNDCQIAYYLPDAFNQQYTDQPYDIVVANILSGPLQLMAPMLCARIATNGALLLSGVLASQADQVITAYRPFLALTVWAEQEGWVALVGHASDASGA